MIEFIGTFAISFVLIVPLGLSFLILVVSVHQSWNNYRYKK